MPAQPKAPTPADVKQSQSAADLNAATDASRASHTETPTAPTAPPEATNGSPRRARKERTRREGPRPEHAFLISVHAALAAGVPVETVVPVLQYAKRAEGAAAWNMLRKTLDDMTREITGEPEPDEDAASDDDTEDAEDDNES
jgi:hypothetical protein